ncbi:hypothetical protein OG444_35080 [Streptomyces sp. NBC_01232]|uniref:hypothetical protein n=1 Tax=unclassified Streptomyces TaxID=2593676 RepID=UPI002E0F0387|nr:hypothetical protein OG444_35080 [Streptomyces sp. NBC_01232]
MPSSPLLPDERLSAGAARPAMPGRRHLDRPVADPDGAPIAVAHGIHGIHDATDVRISELRTRLAP